MLFGRKKAPEKTILTLDVEQGSVGSALVRISPNEPPRIFGEFRTHLPLGDTRRLHPEPQNQEPARASRMATLISNSKLFSFLM